MTFSTAKMEVGGSGALESTIALWSIKTNLGKAIIKQQPLVPEWSSTNKKMAWSQSDDPQ